MLIAPHNHAGARAEWLAWCAEHDPRTLNDIHRERAAAIAAQDATRRAIVGAAPVDHEGRTLTLASTCGHYALNVWYDGRCNSCHQRNLSGVGA